MTGWTGPESDIETASDPIADDLAVVWHLDNAGWNSFAFSWPRSLNTLTTLEPGRGYLLDMNASATLPLPARGEDRMRAVPAQVGRDLEGVRAERAVDRAVRQEQRGGRRDVPFDLPYGDRLPVAARARGCRRGMGRGADC